MQDKPPAPDLILDAHLDIAFAALVSGREWTRPVYESRRTEAGSETEMREGVRVAGLREALLGRVGIAFGTIFTSPARKGAQFRDDLISYHTPREAYERGLAQLDYYNRLADEYANIALIRTQPELDRVLASWAEGVPFAQHIFGIVILMEGADPILEPKQFEEWYERGVRVVGPAWEQTRYSAGTGESGPLTGMGRELLDVMASFNAVLDLSHLAERACDEALDLYDKTLIASHSNSRKLAGSSERHLTDSAIRRIGERGGVVGIPMYNRFLKAEWSRASGGKKEEVTLADVVSSIDYICQLTGSAAHVGIGSDFDGGFGLQSVPAEIDTIIDLTLVAPALAARGYQPDDIRAILSGNFLRILRQTLPM